MIKMDLDIILRKNMQIDTEEYNFIISKGIANINNFLCKKNVPCHVSADEKISIVHDALIKFEEYYDEGRNVKPSSFFYYVLKQCLINTNKKNQEHNNNEMVCEDDVLYRSIDGGIYED